MIIQPGALYIALITHCFLTFTLSHVALQRSIMAKAGGQNSKKKTDYNKSMSN